MTIRIGVNGFGRIGRNFFRALDAQIAQGKNTDLEIVAVNDLTSTDALAHLLKFDSILGRLPYDVRADGDTLIVGETKIKALAVKEGPAALPWGDLGVDIVVESTGIFTDAAKAKAAEAAAKTAWSGKLDAYQLCRSQERVAAHFFATAKAQGQDVRPAVTTPPCTDPGPFAYTPPEPKPAEAAGAHSPAATTAAPPSGTQPAAQVTPTPEKK